MAKEIERLECLSMVSSAIIATPSLSLSSFGIEKETTTKLLTYTGAIDPIVAKSFSKAAAMSAGLAGAGVLVFSSYLASIGLIAGASVSAAAAGAAGLSATGIGLVAAPFIIAFGIRVYKKKKKEQEQKDRVYKELIAKQQAAINRQKEINRELDKILREQQTSLNELKEERARLKSEINNLMELIEVLTEQINQFKKAA